MEIFQISMLLGEPSPGGGSWTSGIIEEDGPEGYDAPIKVRTSVHGKFLHITTSECTEDGAAPEGPSSSMLWELIKLNESHHGKLFDLLGISAKVVRTPFQEE